MLLEKAIVADDEGVSRLPFPDPLQNLRDRLLMRSAHRLGLPLREDNEVSLLEDGSAILEASRALIGAASHSILFEIYIWADDAAGREIAELILKAKSRGVDVRGVVDAFGTLGSGGLLSRLDGVGIPLLRFHPVAPWRPLRIMNRRNHRKLLIIDGREAVIGSANWGLDYDAKANPGAFLDMGVALRGPIVADLAEDFSKVWARAGGEPFETMAVDCARAWNGPWLEPASVQLVSSSGRRGARAIRRHLRLLFSQAQKALLIANAYFIPGRSLLRLLGRAAKRGVDVRVLVPGHSDNGFVQAASRSMYSKLLKSGVRVFERQGRMLHSKVAVFDESIVLIGSGNFDPRSFRLNLELNLAIQHPGLVAQVRRIIEAHQAESAEIEAQAWTLRPWWLRAYEQFAYLFRWWL